MAKFKPGDTLERTDLGPDHHPSWEERVQVVSLRSHNEGGCNAPVYMVIDKQRAKPYALAEYSLKKYIPSKPEPKSKTKKELMDIDI